MPLLGRSQGVGLIESLATLAKTRL